MRRDFRSFCLLIGPQITWPPEDLADALIRSLSNDTDLPKGISRKSKLRCYLELTPPSGVWVEDRKLRPELQAALDLAWQRFRAWRTAQKKERAAGGGRPPYMPNGGRL